MERFAKRSANRDRYQHCADEEKHHHRIDRPDEMISQLEGDVNKELGERHNCGKSKECSAENVKISAAKSYRENYYRAEKHAYHKNYRESEG